MPAKLSACSQEFWNWTVYDVVFLAASVKVTVHWALTAFGWPLATAVFKVKVIISSITVIMKIEESTDLHANPKKILSCRLSASFGRV